MFLGIDGGQTKVVGVILSSSGEILARKTTGAMPFMGELNSECLLLFSQLIKDLCKEASCSFEDIEHLCGGLCGIDCEEQAREKTGILSEYLNFPKDKITLVNDAIIALWAGTQHPQALLLQHGTAFTSAYRNGHSETEVFDCTDIGRIYDIREELLVLVARMIDGRAECSPLKEKLLSFFSIEDERDFGFAIDSEVVPHSLQKNSVEFIFDTWLEGDSGAEKIIEAAAEEYALMISVMLKKCSGNSVDVILGGGVLNRAPDVFFELCKSKLPENHSTIRLVRPLLAPVFGAALFAANIGSEECSGLFSRVQEAVNK